MITKFNLIDAAGNTIGHGEMENGIYRVFSPQFLGGCAEFKDVEAIFAAQRVKGVQYNLKCFRAMSPRNN